MEISFNTKEESNNKRKTEFLSLPQEERFLRFLLLCEQLVSLFPTKKEKKNNFVIDLCTNELE